MRATGRGTLTAPPSFAGLIVGTLLGAGALGPSLLPRAPLIAGLLVGACAAVGYGAGAVGGWAVRVVRGRPEWHSSAAVRLAARALAAVVLVAAGVWGLREQQALAELMGTPPPGAAWPVVAVVLGAALAVVLVLLGRGARALTGALARLLARVAPARVATAVAVAVVLVAGALLAVNTPQLLAAGLAPLFASMNAATSPGTTQPASPVVSGSPRSAVTWQSLGHDGRDFIGATPTVAQLATDGSGRVRPPVRVYVGVDSAADPVERAGLAVRDLDTFGAWDRAVLAVGTSTGTGTVDESQVLPLEQRYRGDVATVSTQYSVLPSFLSFLVDGENAQEAAHTLFAAVHERWLQQPPGRRPLLVVFGESLGAYGGNSVFPDLASVGTVDGALFVGPPNATELWRSLTDDRTAGTPERLPQYGAGAVVRWADAPADLAQPVPPWGPHRLAYLQNASDPVVWWSPDLLWARPDWLAEPRGPDVLPHLTWLPLLTFAGLTGDMINSQGVPAPHGHVYGDRPGEAWDHILPPP